MCFEIKHLLIYLFSMMVTFAPALANAQDDLRKWAQFHAKLTRPSKLSVGIHTELRLQNNAGTINSFFVGPTVDYQLNDYLAFGGAAKYILMQTSVLEQWQRLELEVNPQIELFDNRLYLQLRNRAEFVRITMPSPDSWRIRARHRLTLAVNLDNAGPLERLYAGNELFWGQPFSGPSNVVIITENRFVPFGARFRLSDIAKISIFYMLRSLNGADPWQREHTIGTFVSIAPPRLSSP